MLYTLYCLVQKQDTDNMDECDGAPIKFNLKTRKLEFYTILTYHEVLFFFFKFFQPFKNHNHF